VNAEDVWQVQAVGQTLALSGSVTVTVFLQSERLRVDPNPGPNPGHDLTLEAHDTLPDAMAFRFDAAQDQLLGLSNGAQIFVPAGALAPSGFVTLLARPLVELADDGGAQPVSFGYRLQAFDDAGLPITHFNAPVTLVIPFTADQLAALGVSAEQLVPQYWDATCNCWKPVPTVSVQTDLSGNGTVSVALEHFTDFALTAAQAMVQVYLPLMQR
jgi:hypothetical protein